MKKTPYLVLFLVILLLSAALLLTGCFEGEEIPVSSVQTESPAVNQPDPPSPQKSEPSDKEYPVLSADPPPSPQSNSDSWYFQRNNQHQVPYVEESIKKRLRTYNAFYFLETSGQQIYLTFDEGYELGYTGEILDILKANDVNAIFFITGHYIDSQPELVLRMKQEGHLVGSHTVNHPDLGIADRETIKAEVTGLEEKYSRLTGMTLDKYLRPPMGLYTDASLAVTADLGYSTVFWSMAFNDWDPNNQPGAKYSYQHVIDNIHPGAVILLHAVSQSNTQALDRIIKDLKAAGYIFSVFP